MRDDRLTSPKRIATIVAVLVLVLFLSVFLWVRLQCDVDATVLSAFQILNISIYLVLFSLSVILAPFFWCRGMFHMISMARAKREDLDPSAYYFLRFMPLKIYFFPELLTPAGLSSRLIFRHSIFWFAFLILPVVAWKYVFDPFST